jgi:hypothetical protein
MSQDSTGQRRRGGPRGPLMPQTIGGRTLLTKGASADRLGWSVGHLNRLLRQKKLNLTEYHLYEGAPSRLAEDEVEALKK